MALTLRPLTFAHGEAIITKGEVGSEMYFVCRGQVEVVDGGKQLTCLGPGDHFGELALLNAAPRNASVRAIGPCDVFALSKADFLQVLSDHPDMAAPIHEIAQSRYGVADEL
jgi:CRP-like cAMP-binding protein